MSYNIAAIDVHKKVLMVAVATTLAASEDPVGDPVSFECAKFGAGASERHRLIAWLQQRHVQELVLESTAQYWKPIWLDLEPHFQLHLAQAHSNRAPRGRKDDFRDTKRLARRFLAGELLLSFVPEPEQRTWRLLTRGRTQLVRDRVRLQNQIEALLEEARIKLSSVITDLLGQSGRRILTALSRGQTDPDQLADLGDGSLKCSREELVDALRGPAHPLHQELLRMHLKRLAILDSQIDQLSAQAAQALRPHQDAIMRLAKVPGFGVESAQQLIAELGPDAEAFHSASQLAAWIGVCPGSNISAGENQSSHSPKGNCYVRRILAEAAHGASITKNSRFQRLLQCYLRRMPYPAAIWAVAHHLTRVVWKILHTGVEYIEYGASSTPQAAKRRIQRLTKAFRDLGYSIVITPTQVQPATESPARLS
jgi:transposase